MSHIRECLTSRLTICYDSFHWKFNIPKIHQIEELKFLGISRYKFEFKFCFDSNLYQVIWDSEFEGFRGCSIFSGICHTSHLRLVYEWVMSHDLRLVYEWVMSHDLRLVYEWVMFHACVTWLTHTSTEQGIKHAHMCDVTHTEQRSLSNHICVIWHIHTSTVEYVWLMSDICAYQNRLCRIWGCYLKESCLTYEWVMSHIWMS